MALSQNRFVLSNSPIAMNLPKYEKILCFFCKIKKTSYDSFYKDKNYSQIKTINSKVLLFIVVSNAVLIKYEIFDPEKGTTKVAMLKLWLVCYISNI